MNRLFALGVASVMLTGAAHASDPMMDGVNGWAVSDAIFTVGETIDDYTPPGILDGIGAYELDAETVRLFVNHELLNFRGYPYEINDGAGGTFSMLGARVSYFDIDKASKQVVGSGLAYHTIYDQTGSVATDISFLSNDFAGFSRFCSSALFEAEQFGPNRGLVDRIYFTSEEDGGFFNGTGANEWGLDPETQTFWALPALGRGGWENMTMVDTGRDDYVACLLADDTSPFDFNPDAADGEEAAPLFLYVGQKNPNGDFPARNGLRDGSLFVWVSDTGETTPLEFNGSGTLAGRWVQVNNSPTGTPSEDGSSGYDEYGFPAQGTLWIEARALGAFGFSRPEDVSVNPMNGAQVVLASTGVDTYAVDPNTGDGVDTFGTLYTIDFDFTDIMNPTADITILYDGDADPTRALRSPDNLDWADDGMIYVQEDRAETATLTGEPLFGDGAVNPNEAGIVRVDPTDASTLRVANVDRSVVLDGSIATPSDAIDVDAGIVGAWESSGILDVSALFGQDAGTLFIIDVQAHGIEDQDQFNAGSRINDDDLVEGGQLLFLAPCPCDLDSDNMVNFADLTSLLADWGVCEDCRGDIDGDGDVDFDDLQAFIANWGPCIN